MKVENRQQRLRDHVVKALGKVCVSKWMGGKVERVGWC